MLYDTESSHQVLCDNLEGWDGWEAGGRFKRKGTYVCLWLIMLMCGRDQYNIVKQLSSNFKKQQQSKLFSNDITVVLLFYTCHLGNAMSDKTEKLHDILSFMLFLRTKILAVGRRKYKY